MTPVVFWFRRDLRLRDHEALTYATVLGNRDVLGVFVVDPRLTAPAGPTRVDFVRRSLASLSTSMGGALVVRAGDPAAELLKVAREVGAHHVVATADFAPYGRARDEHVSAALSAAGIECHFVGSPYLVAPGTVRSDAGQALKVFTAFRRRWEPLAAEQVPLAAVETEWRSAESVDLESAFAGASRARPDYFGDLETTVAPHGPLAGEDAAREALALFAPKVSRYGEQRNDPDADDTSRLSPFLKIGALHPRTVAEACRGTGSGEATFLAELGWREFYADVLFHHPNSVREVLQPSLATLRCDTDASARKRFETWARGETGFPLVDAGMRQLREEGWMHNRVRMLAASFLVKHLHLDWRWGARWFMWNLADGDVASNQHGWQWTAGTGTDAAPFHRIFNPTLQAERFDPEGTYIRRYVPELATLDAPACRLPGGGSGLFAAENYAPAMIDLDVERKEALARFAAARETVA